MNQAHTYSTNGDVYRTYCALTKYCRRALLSAGAYNPTGRLLYTVVYIPLCQAKSHTVPSSLYYYYYTVGKGSSMVTRYTG